MDSVPLVVVDRGGRQESIHRGAVAVVDPDGRILYAAGDPALPLFLRSFAKPLQSIPLVESGGADRFELTERELAVICGSHSGEPMHIEAVRAILAKAGLDEKALQCGAHPPLDPTQAAVLIREGRRPEPIHNNCSGKHAGMLAACRTRDWPVDSYLDPDHPLQREIAGIVADFCGVPAEGMPRGIDGCGVPTFHVTVHAAGLAFARLADPSRLPDGRARAVGRITHALAAHPEMMSGTGRLCAALMTALGDRLFCKTGGEAVFGIGLPSRGWGIGIKIEDGSSRGMGAVAVEALRQLGVPEAEHLAALAEQHHPVIRNHAGREVGQIRAVFRLEEVS